MDDTGAINPKANTVRSVALSHKDRNVWRANFKTRNRTIMSVCTTLSRHSEKARSLCVSFLIIPKRRFVFFRHHVHVPRTNENQ